MSKQEKFDIPEILYESPSYAGESVSPIPYIFVEVNKKMPPVLFIFEYKQTGEMEYDERGRPSEVIDQIPHKYVDMELLKAVLSPQLNDQVRVALGMEPLNIAQVKGQKILDKVFAKQDSLIENIENSQPERQKKMQEQLARQKQLMEEQLKKEKEGKE